MLGIYTVYKENVLFKQNVFVCAKVFIFYNAVKPCEICATKVKYLNQCITPGKKAKLERVIPSPRIAAINLIFPLHSIVVLNNEYGADVGRNSTPRISDRPFSWQYSLIYLFLQINWKRGYKPDFRDFSFFSCWDPCVHRESNKMALIARRVVSSIRSKNAFI